MLICFSFELGTHRGQTNEWIRTFVQHIRMQLMTQFIIIIITTN